MDWNQCTVWIGGLFNSLTGSYQLPDTIMLPDTCYICSMRIDRFLIALIPTVALIIILNTQLASIPPLGKFLNPVNGFMANAETDEDLKVEHFNFNTETNSNTAASAIDGSVYMDERMVPHIFATDDNSLYFIQGFIHAKYRLWQMETQTRAAAGRLSEILGPALLDFDRQQRRIGMVTGAENALEELKKDPVSQKCISSYTNGVNEYIRSLGNNYAKLPLEYKLLNYQPEEWTPLKTMLLLKYMANTLTGFDSDVEYTNLIKKLGRKDFDLLFPDRPEGIDPIIPSEKVYDYVPSPIDTAKEYFNEDYYRKIENKKTENDGVGSNNWAVSPSKTKNGHAILCNDPHLQLNLPALWFEVQLQSPTQNVYGASLPGAPGVVIGFNDSISWGVTNGGRDVRDWYNITWRLGKREEYRYNDGWLKIDKKIEVIKVKGEDDFIDTVFWTIHGPMVYTGFGENKGDWENLAMRWAAIDASNDFKTFYLLNHAKNFDDYRNAIQFFSCPTQNFVFASVNGDIAITQEGKHAIKWPEQGRFVLDGKDPASTWQKYIPWEQNPFIKNPERGFVSSANQHPTDGTYPYYYTGFDFEFYRNRRINDQLSKMDQITIEDLQHLQQDNYNYTASEVLQFMLLQLRPRPYIPLRQALTCLDCFLVEFPLDTAPHPEPEFKILSDLANWDYLNNADALAPTYFQIWWDTLYNLLWDEFIDPDTAFVAPDNYYTMLAMKHLPDDFKYFDIQDTSKKKETLTDVINLSYDAAMKIILQMQTDDPESLKWYLYKHTSILHIAQIPALSRLNIENGGYRNIVNASSERNGPSWRMVVEMSNPINAYGIYPGGQSGNPGSKYYDDFVDDWANGKYYKLQFFPDESSAKQQAKFFILFNSDLQ